MSTLTFLGHDAFTVEHEGNHLVFDPFISGNPAAFVDPKNIKANFVLLTHGHGDHLGDGIEIAQANDAVVIAPFELATYCGNKGCRVHPMHIGGSHEFAFGRVKLTIAHHGSGADLGGDALAYMGNPCGFLLTLDGKTVYHAGDTGLFLDMKLIGELNSVDIALLPIGDNFTMGIDDAARAVDFLKPKLVVPMHYNTFEAIQSDPKVFKEKVEQKGVTVRILQPGESMDF